MKKTIYFLLICFTGILFSCKEDEGILNPYTHEKTNTGYKRSVVSFAEMKTRLSSHSGNALSIFGSIANKGGEEYIQEIDSTYIVQYSNDTLTTFTMRVRTMNEESYTYSNLIIKTIEGEIEELVVHYKPTEEWQASYDIGEKKPYEGDLDITDTQGRSMEICTVNLVPFTCGCAMNTIEGYYLVIHCNSVPTLGGGGGNGGGNNPPYDGGGGGGPIPTDPMDWGGGGYGGGYYPGGGNGNYTNLDFFLQELSNEQIAWLSNNYSMFNQIEDYLEANNYDYHAHNFAIWAIDYLMDNPNYNFDKLLRMRTSYDPQTGDINNNSVGGYDNTNYPILSFPQVLQNWPSVPNVIPANEFIGWNTRNYPTWDCMDYAKEQIRIKGYQISNYGDSGQTFQIYKEQTGVNLNALSQGLSYLKYALTNGIPVIVGIDNRQGSPNPQTDNTTDHFIVIVGTGIENGEIFFRFYDNASGYPHEGTHLENKLYLDNFLNMLIGTTRAEGYRESYTDYDYIVTQIRKSKPL